MSLLECRECGAHVSSKAQSCPHCGVSAPTRRKGIHPIVIGALVILLVVVLAQCAASHHPQADPSLLNQPPSGAAIADFRQLDRQFHDKIAVCQLAAAENTMGLQGGANRYDLYSTAKTNEGVCRLNADKITKMVIPASIDAARSEKLRSAMDKCADSMGANAYLLGKYAEFYNGEMRPKDVTDLKGGIAYARDTESECLENYRAVVAGLALPLAADHSEGPSPDGNSAFGVAAPEPSPRSDTRPSQNTAKKVEPVVIYSARPDYEPEPPQIEPAAPRNQAGLD